MSLVRVRKNRILWDAYVASEPHRTFSEGLTEAAAVRRARRKLKRIQRNQWKDHK